MSRHPKSEIRKRRLPNRDQIEYFRMGHTSMFQVQNFQDQFLEFWHNLPPSYRDDDDDASIIQQDRAAFIEQHYALNEDEFKHNINSLPDNLSTSDLIIPPPHTIIRKKINTAVKHYMKLNTEKELNFNNTNDDDEFLIDDELISLTITDTPQKRKRRKLNQKNKNKNHNNKLDGFIIDDDDYNNQLTDDDLDLRLETKLFGVKIETPNNNNNAPTLRRSTRNRNRNKNKNKTPNNTDNTDNINNDSNTNNSNNNTANSDGLNLDLNLSAVSPPPLQPTNDEIRNENDNDNDIEIIMDDNNNNNKKDKSPTKKQKNNNSKNQTPLLRKGRGRPSQRIINDKEEDNDSDYKQEEDISNTIALLRDTSPSKSAKKSKKRKRKDSMPSLISDNTNNKSNSKSKKKNIKNKRINDRPHVLFAANVEMPYYDQLIVPFEKFQEKRKDYKSTNSKKEVNSVTKLSRNHRLQQIEKTKGCKLLRENECLLRVAIFHSNKSSERYTKSHEYLVLSTQKLSDLKDSFYCLMDQTPIGKEIENSYFFIEDTFYDDCRHKNHHRISQDIIDWSRCDQHWKQTGVYVQNNMENVRFCDLNIRLGSHYLYVHQGDCQHVIIFTECRIANKWDCNNCYAYPVTIYRQILKRQKCGVCEMYPAKYVTYGDKLTTHNPFFFCERCYYPFHYDKNGKLLYDDFQVFDYIHD